MNLPSDDSKRKANRNCKYGFTMTSTERHKLARYRKGGKAKSERMILRLVLSQKQCDELIAALQMAQADALNEKESSAVKLENPDNLEQDVVLEVSPD